jgi:hypothetical protein
MKLITGATTPKGYFKYLLESCTRNNSDIIVFDWKTPWKGFNQKFLSLKKYLSDDMDMDMDMDVDVDVDC